MGHMAFNAANPPDLYEIFNTLIEQTHTDAKYIKDKVKNQALFGVHKHWYDVKTQR